MKKIKMALIDIGSTRQTLLFLVQLVFTVLLLTYINVR